MIWDLHITVSGLAVKKSSHLKCSKMLIVWLCAITEGICWCLEMLHSENHYCKGDEIFKGGDRKLQKSRKQNLIFHGEELHILHH